MKSVLSLLVVATIGGFLFPLPLKSSEQPAPEVGIVEKLGTTIPLDVELYDEQGYKVPLRQLVNKTTVLTLVYYRCASICNPLLTELSRIVEKMDLELGKDYQILTISFDHHEKPELAASKRESYLSSIRVPVNPAGWRFLTGDSASIRRVTDAAGFYFKQDSSAWIHAAALIVLSPTGKVTRYVNGIQYLPFDVKMAIIEGMEGKEGPTIARLLRFCYSYDRESRSYAFNITRVGGVVIVALAVLFAVVFLVRPRKKSSERIQRV